MKKFIKPIIYLSVFITICAAISLSAQPSDIFFDQREKIALGNKIHSLVVNGNLPSLQVAVIHEDSIIWSNVFGTGSDKNSMYMIGSVQKVFTATAILQLHEKGLLHIDDDINSYLPFIVRHPQYPEVPITISMLLSHRSGMEMLKNQVEWDARFLAFNKDGVIKDLPDVALMSQENYLRASLDPSGVNYDPSVWHFKPGTNYIYSVSAQYILFYLIEKVSGLSYSTFMRENVFKPLEMNNTMFYKDDTTANFVTPHERRNVENIKLPFWAGERDFICSTAEDMAKFMIAHINDGHYKDFQLLRPETIALMREKHSPGKNIFHLSSKCPFNGYGLGIIQYSNNCFGHGGSTFGFQSLWIFNNSNKKGYIILTNLNGILYGQENFNSVWNTMSSIEKEVKSELEFSVRSRKIYAMAIFVIIGILINALYFRHKFYRKKI